MTGPDEEVVVSHNWDELRHIMWNYVSTVRMDKQLGRMQHHTALLREEITKHCANFRVNHNLLELCNLVEATSLIADSALLRHESHDPHFSRDYPETLPKALSTVMQPTHRQIAQER